MSLILIPILFAYSVLIIALIVGNNILYRKKKNQSSKYIKVSIVVPFRDEENNLIELVNCLLSQSYPKEKYEVLFIDDHSEDRSCQLLKELDTSFHIHTLSDKFGKKAAIQKGVFEAKGELILTTDADCLPNNKWIQSMVDTFISNESDFLIGPVHIKSNGFNFQEIEFSSLIAVTSGVVGFNRPILCNGANLGFKKSIFEKINPYESNMKIKSGDDIFFLHTLKKTLPKSKIIFVASSEALVHTKPVDTLINFVNQRIRWSNKVKYYQDFDSFLLGLIITSMNIALIILLLNGNNELLLFSFSIKLILDMFLILSARSWLGLKNPIIKSIVLSFVYPFYFLFFALLSLLYKPKWKGRIQ